ncbi:hypothetical protein LINPERHAP2_LOCUS19388 [Linum perenne]
MIKQQWGSEGRETVAEYTTRFDSLLRYGGPQFQDPETQMNHYLQNLRHHILHVLSAQVWENREDVYQAALRIERTDQTIYEERTVSKKGNKRQAPSQPGEQSHFSHSKRRVTKSSNQAPTHGHAGSTRSVANEINHPTCDLCGKKHHGECRLLHMECFNCGEHGHLQQECPNRGSQGEDYLEQTVMGGRAQTENQLGEQSNRHDQSRASGVGRQPRTLARRNDMSNANRRDGSRNNF